MVQCNRNASGLLVVNRPHLGGLVSIHEGTCSLKRLPWHHASTPAVALEQNMGLHNPQSSVVCQSRSIAATLLTKDLVEHHQVGCQHLRRQVEQTIVCAGGQLLLDLGTNRGVRVLLRLLAGWRPAAAAVLAVVLET